MDSVFFPYFPVSSLTAGHHGGLNFSKLTRDSTITVMARNLCWLGKWLSGHIKLKLKQSNQSATLTQLLNNLQVTVWGKQPFFLFSTQPSRWATATNHLWSTVTWPAAIARGQWELWWSLPATLDTLWNRARSPLNVWTPTIPNGTTRSPPAEVGISA